MQLVCLIKFLCFCKTPFEFALQSVANKLEVQCQLVKRVLKDEHMHYKALDVFFSFFTFVF